MKIKKSHTCEEGGAHLRNAFWHLLMNFEKHKNSEFWKNKKNCWRYHHFTHLYQKPQSYEVQFLRYRVRQIFALYFTKLFVILDYFLPFYPPNNSENQNFKNMKKLLTIILYMITINPNHIMWCMIPEIWSTTDRFFSHFGPFFDPFTPHPTPPLTTQRIKILKKWKEPLEILSLYTNDNISRGFFFPFNPLPPPPTSHHHQP